MKKLPLSGGCDAIVDDADFDALLQWKWSSAVGGKYAARGQKVDGKKVVIYLHRQITDCPAGLYVDHINGNGLDNRRCNLRIVTQSENISKKRSPGNRTGYRGVYETQAGKFVGEVRINKKKIKSRSLATPQEAAMFHDRLASIHLGEHAVLNFPSLDMGA